RYFSLCYLRCSAGCEFENSFCGLGREVPSESEQAILVGLTHVSQPFRGHAVSQKHLVRSAGQRSCDGFRRGSRLHVRGDDNLAYRLAELDDLRSAGRGMRFQLATLRPRVRAIMMIDVAEEETGVGPVDDEPYVGVHPYRPK